MEHVFRLAQQIKFPRVVYDKGKIEGFSWSTVHWHKSIILVSSWKDHSKFTWRSLGTNPASTAARVAPTKQKQQVKDNEFI